MLQPTLPATLRRALRGLPVLVGIALTTVALSTAPAHATVHREALVPTLEIRGEAPRAGEPVRATLRLRATGDGRLEKVRVGGPGWRLVRLDGPTRAELERLDTVEFELVAVPSDPARPLRVEASFGGVPWSAELDASVSAWERALPRRLVGADRASDGLVSDEQRDERQRDRRRLAERLRPALEQARRQLDDGLEKRTAQAATHTVVGRVGYYDLRPGTAELVMAEEVRVDLLVLDGSGTLVDYRVGATDVEGEFEFQFDSGGGAVDLFVTARPENPHVVVVPPGGGSSLRFIAEARAVAPGTRSMGLIVPRDEADHPVFHVANTVRRTQDYFEHAKGFPMPRLTAHWPEPDDGPSYYDGSDVHLTRSSGMSERVIAHEFGHFWADEHAANPGFTYCNGLCDGEDGSCGHCIWCEEFPGVAYNEGVANWFSLLATNVLDTFPSPEQVEKYALQTVFCGCDDQCDPYATEGFLAAFLYDLGDYDPGEDDPFSPGFADRTHRLTDDLLAVLTTSCPDLGRRPWTPGEIARCLMERLPDRREDIWETARNNGMDFDDDPPPTPTGLYSSDHQTNVSSPDLTLSMHWTRPEDDMSGIAGYSYRITANIPMSPDQIQDIGDFTTLISSPLGPGTWYVTLRARDRSGKWSTDYAVAGPYVLEQPTPADLQYTQRSGWDHPIVPRDDTTATGSNTTVSTGLTGGGLTWWNVVGRNDGQAAAPQSVLALTVDGETEDTTPWPYLAGGNDYSKNNLGPVNIRGGRHTFGMFLDGEETVGEPDEDDNFWARQFVWNPTPLTKDYIFRSTSPPRKDGGFEHIRSGQVAYWNSWGFALDPSLVSQAVWTFASSGDEDYDLYLYDGYSVPDRGFETPQSTSARGPGLLDAVVLQGIPTTFVDRNLGVINADGGSSSMVVSRIEGITVDGPTGWGSVNMDVDEMMHLYTITTPSGDPVYATFELDNELGEKNLHLAYFDEGFTHGGLADATQRRLAHPGAQPHIEVEIPASSTVSVAIYRDPRDGRAATSYGFEYRHSRPDLALPTPLNWASAVVPRPDASIAYPFSVVGAPSSLPGGESSTYLYLSETNLAAPPAGGGRYQLWADGEELSYFSRPSLDGNSTRLFRGASPFLFAGGRHTLSARIDAQQEVIESLEYNNTQGRQWVWSPQPLGLGSALAFAEPPDRAGGFGAIDEGLAFYNCLGFETPFFGPSTGLFGAVWVAGENVDADLDLRLHEVVAGTIHGFTLSEVQSAVGGDDADFVIVDFAGTSYRPFHAGVVKSSGTGPGHVQAEGSQILGGSDPRGTHGPFALGANDAIDLHDVNLQAGTWVIELLHPSPATVDLGLSVYGRGAGQLVHPEYFSRVDALPGGIAWQEPAGAKETLVVEVPQSGPTCLAVWRADGHDLDTAVDYTLRLQKQSATGLPDSGAPTRTALTGVAPNPFNPRTTIHFDLARTDEVRLDLYNVRGEHVRSLLRGSLAAGRHSVSWDGRDDTGSTVSSGMYVARLVAAGVREQIRLTLLK